MKKYYCEATKKQWEKPTESKQYLCATAKTIVLAENDEDALKAAALKLREEYLGTGTILGETRITKVAELIVDWSYGYGDERTFGTDEDKKALRAQNTL